MSGVELIAAERQRQVEEEGFTAEQDQAYDNQELALAAASYALPLGAREVQWAGEAGIDCHPRLWPWAARWYKPSPNDRVRELVKAGALIAAEIDRLQRGGA